MPKLVVAVTVNVYVTPLTRLRTVHVVNPVVAQPWPPLPEAVTV